VIVVISTPSSLKMNYELNGYCKKLRNKINDMS